VTLLPGDNGAVRGDKWTLHELSDCPVGMDPVALDRFVRDAKLTESQKTWLIGRECRDCGKSHDETSQQPAPQRASCRSVVDLLGAMTDNKRTDNGR